MVDHIDVVQIRGSCLIGQVDRVIERQVPYREGLELGVAGLHAAAVLVIELGEAGRHLAASGTRRRHNDERSCGLDIIIAAVSLFADNQRDVGGIAGDRIVAVDLQAQGLELFLVRNSGGLVGEAGQNDASDVETVACEGVHKAEQILVIGDAEIAADLVLLDVGRVDRDDDFGLVLELAEHCDLGVGLEAGKHAGRMIVVKELAAEFQIELSAEFADSLSDMFGLCFEILIIIKSDLHDDPLRSGCAVV